MGCSFVSKPFGSMGYTIFREDFHLQSEKETRRGGDKRLTLNTEHNISNDKGKEEKEDDQTSATQQRVLLH